MTTLVENPHTGAFILSVASGQRSFGSGTLGASQSIKAGQVLGKVAAALEASSAAKAGGNTGTGTFVLDPTTPVLAGAKIGVYTLRCIASATNGGTFRLEDPDGFVLTEVTISGGAGGTAAVNEQIKGTLTDADPDFIVGDGFDITVVEDDDATDIGHYVAFDQDGTDGSQNAVAIAYAEAETGVSETKGITLVERDAEVIGDELTWPDDIDADEQAAAVAQLKALGVIVR
jgi:hypothetical protein